MKYISTRGGIEPIGFKEAVMMGLARDGGLLLPDTIPAVNKETIKKWQGLKFADLSFEVIRLFAPDIPAADLKEIIQRSYATFSHPEVTPLVKHGKVHILELFHGPTLAFKDVALQFLGNVFEYLLKESGQRMNILGATSGDTGSAAIYGVRGKERINIFIIHPHKRVSRIQELQMTTVVDANVFNIAIRGTFDDGQAIVKTIFNDLDFKDKYGLGAINSINWARIVAQVVYYIYAALQFKEGRVDFSVPTGNFGDIFAGFIARRMLPDHIRNLVLATNENDLLSRFVTKGEYSLGKVVQTTSPSMDIQVASNFERFLYYLYNEDSGRTREAMASFGKSGRLEFSQKEQQRIKENFFALAVNQSETTATIADFHKETGYVLDPHTAVGVRAALHYIDDQVPMVCLSTAHPAKFGDAVLQAIGREPELPASVAGLEDKESRCQILDADVDQVKAFVEANGL
ncbi:MAG: threonine synthase [Proteobacteria bacterium]|nr:threonine synthase [Pseudomonadota bacterium]MBU1639493.1 threonine synthase [Pseudomonadota bacterium]